MSLLVVQYSFDEDGLLSRVTASGGGGENWEEKIVRDSEGLKIEKIFSGGIRMTRTYDAYGNVISQKSRSFRQDGYDRRYAWNASGRLQSVIDGITGGRTSYAYDAVGNLMSARYEDGTDDYRMPDAVGNVFRSRDRRDREYGKGGRILRDRHYDYLYDVEGNLILKTPRRGLTQHPNHEVSEESGTHIAWQTGDYAYEWYGNGMLKEVRLPYGKTVRFEYDALGRRTAKLFNGHVFRYLWDGNVMVQEWQYEEKDRPQHSIDEFGRIRMLGDEPVENLVTWVYEEGLYVPVAKLQNGERYTIISDYMGRPVEAYNSYGNVVWQADYDIYGDLRNIKGIRDFIPFRQLGQYEDDETRLYYNRFRYYDPRIGNYISQDPIRLSGNNPTLYGYVGDCNWHIDIFGLSDSSKLGAALGPAPGVNHDAHHIVMANSTDSRMVSLRNQMENFTPPIGKNSKENGIWLPRQAKDRIAGTKLTAHKGEGIHSDAYKQSIYDRLNNKGREEFIAELDLIKEELNDGKTFKCKS